MAKMISTSYTTASLTLSPGGPEGPVLPTLPFIPLTALTIGDGPLGSKYSASMLYQ